MRGNYLETVDVNDVSAIEGICLYYLKLAKNNM